MSLYGRDYLKLTEEEKKIARKIEAKRSMSGTQLMSIPDFYFFYKALFPNNMLDTDELKSSSATERIAKFISLINQPTTTEREVINFISSERAYFIMASVLSYYDFGHHSAFIFPEFPLGNNYVCDYLVIGKASGGHQFIFVELESCHGSTTMKDGDLGSSIRKGRSQVESWDLWLEQNFSNLYSTFAKYKNPSAALPDEFYKLDKSRIHFVVVAGRRNDYTDVTYRKRRKLLKDDNIRLLHFDNLIESAQNVCDAGNYV